MNFCPRCGTQVTDSTINYCPTCGGQLNANQNVNNANNMNNMNGMPNMNQGYNTNQGYAYNQNVNPGMMPRVSNKSIVTCILLSIITCGIYGIIWYINMVDDVNTICQDGKSSGGTVFLLTLITCGIYGWVWWYNAGTRMLAANKRFGKTQSDNAVLYLILMLFGLGIVNYCLLQNNLNEYSN